MRFIVNGKTDSIDGAAAPQVHRTSLGGKAQALAALSQAAAPLSIPDWFVLLPAAYEHCLTDALDAVPSPTVRAELATALAQLCPNGDRVAVRSSASDEDGVGHSFAGQLESFLFVAHSDVPAKIAAVWRSGFSDRVLAYRQEHHLAPPAAPAVLIQKMVDADVAGVAFSANPISGQRSVAVVSAVYGLGTTLVSGAAEADLYQVDRRGQIFERRIAHKQFAERFDLRSATVQTMAVAAEEANQPALTDEQVLAIVALVRQVEQQFGCPQDIEWAIAEGQLYLLQARPITTLDRLNDPDGALNLWDNSNIVESYGGITTPLTFSFAHRAYEEVYRQFCRIMGVSADSIAQHDTTFRRMLGLVRGRIYYNLLSWYRVLALLPGFTLNRRFMEQMMGVREELPGEILAELKPAQFGDKWRDGWRLGGTIAGLIKNYLTLPRQIQRFYWRLDAALSLPNSALEAMRPDELAAHYHDLERKLLTRWDAPLVNDFFAMIFYGVLRKLTIAWCGDAGTLQNDLVSGEGGMISAEPAQLVQQMATIAARHPKFVGYLVERPLSEILRQMNDIPDFKLQYQAYLEKFGDRCLEELKLESPTLHDDPLLLLRSIGQLAKQPMPIRSKESAPRQLAEQRVKQLLQGDPVRSILFGWVLGQARARVRDRENLRFERTRLFGRARRIFVELGKRLAAIERLESPRDIFYLEVAEILGFVDGTATCTNLKGLVAVRKAEFEGYRSLAAPGDRFETRGVVHQGNSFEGKTPEAMGETQSQTSDTLQGMGCCPGIVRAPVQIVTDPHNAQLRQGCILVAHCTDPGWIMLFPFAVGLLVERGSLLSHAAIVARELGIPAIVSLPGITSWLRDGDWVELDGSRGTVRRVAIEAAPTLQEADCGK